MKRMCIAAAGGLAAGIVSGLFGGAGGMLLVPVLLRLAEDKKALASTVFAIFPMCALSAYLYREQWRQLDYWPILLGGTVGGLIAGVTFGKVNAKILRKIFALFVLYGGIRTLIVHA